MRNVNHELFYIEFFILLRFQKKEGFYFESKDFIWCNKDFNFEAIILT